MKSFQNVVDTVKPGCFLVQETKLKRKGALKCEGFQIFELVRKDSEGGGLATGILEEFEPVLIFEGDDETEILVVEIALNNQQIQVINAYGPQETHSLERRLKFYVELEKIIETAKTEDKSIVIEMDANAKLGDEIINLDPHKISENGKILYEIMERQNLVAVNSMELCNGVITRHRDTINGEEKSAIDFVIVCENMLEFVKEMTIDEDEIFKLTNLNSSKSNRKGLVTSDHNTIICKFSILYSSKTKRKMDRREIFNFKNPENQKLFKDETDHGNELSKCFDGPGDILEKSAKWIKVLNKKHQKCFRKIRVTKRKKKTEIETLLDQRIELKKLRKNSKCKIYTNIINTKLQIIEDNLTKLSANENAQNIKKQVENLSSLNGGFSTLGVWQVRKKVVPRHTDPPMAKKDPGGNLVTNPELLKKLYINEYTHRLRSREIVPGLEKLQKLKEDLWQRRLEYLSKIKTPDWTMDQLSKALKRLKRNKARDPMGWTNEIFKPDIAGRDLLESLLKLLNSIKNEYKVPKFLVTPDITTIYKNKGEKCDLTNDRGVFKLSVIRTILDTLIYLDKYDEIDRNMSDSNIGGRKKRNIRNHLFVLYGILNSVRQKESRPVDIQLYDIRQCFDSMWEEETMNDMFEICEKDEKLCVVYELNKTAFIAVNTPFGQTERKQVNSIEMQGTVLAPIKCALQVDTIGKECMEKNENIYLYKNLVSIPPLALIDDVAAISECGHKSVKLNCFINTKIEMKKLWFGENKCHQIHVGEENFLCPELKVHDSTMKKVKSDKYLGDIVSYDSLNKENIQARTNRGIGIITQVMILLEEVCLGYHFFETSVLLRESLFLNSILVNIEVCYGLTNEDISNLEIVDKILMRKILEAHSKTPTEALYLELGCIPIRFVIMSRRINFLFYILNRPENDLVRNFFEVQQKYPTKNDWVIAVQKDLNELKIDLTFEDIKNYTKNSFSKLIKGKVKEAAFSYLIELKNQHSKMHMLEYNKLEMQKYLKCKTVTPKSAKTIFKFRTRMSEVKVNFKTRYNNDIQCVIPNCQENDTQKHLLTHSDSGNPEKYNDLFSKNPNENLSITKSLEKVLNLRTIYV